MSSRIGLQLTHSARLARATIKRPIGRRYQVTDAPAAPSQSLASRLWNSPVGVKTVHFWAPVMKWSIVLAGVSDFARPAESLSLTQSVALTCTGIIWTRWCFVIKPRNVLLAAVNFLLGCVGVTQVTRILMYQRSLKDKSVGDIASDDAKEVVDTAKGVVKSPDVAAKKAVN